MKNQIVLENQTATTEQHAFATKFHIVALVNQDGRVLPVKYLVNTAVKVKQMQRYVSVILVTMDKVATNCAQEKMVQTA